MTRYPTPADERLRMLFEPRSVAVVGASTDPRKIGGRPILYLDEAGYSGQILPVNPRYDEIADRRAYPSIEAIDQHVDLALILVAAEHVLDTIEACARTGVGTAIIFSAGFAELGGEGREQQQRITRIAAESGLRVLGPNCLGVLNVQDGMMATFAGSLVSGHPLPGRIGFASQSGAVGSHCMALARERGLGISKWVTTGNEVDIDLADCLRYLTHDDGTDVIVGYIEGARDGEKLRVALEEAFAVGKPVVLLKAGRSSVGAQAARSHTDALVGSFAVYEAMFERYGVHRAVSIDDLLTKAYLFSAKAPPPDGHRVSLVTHPVEAGAMVERAVRSRGLEVSAIDGNGVGFTSAVAASLIDPGTDGTVIFAAATGLEQRFVQDDLERLIELGLAHPTRPKLLTMLLEDEDRMRLEEAGYLVFPELESMLAAVEVSVRHAGARQRASRGLPRGHDVQGSSADARLDGPMTEVDALSLLGAAGLPTVPHALVEDEDAAIEAATRFGWPVVLKIVSPAIAHKSDIGAVALDLGTESQVRAAYRDIWDRSVAAVGEHALSGVLVAPMVAGGVEVIVGMRRDPVFGPVIMCGLGGTMVEVFQDVSVRIPPIDLADAHAMLRGLAAYQHVHRNLDAPSEVFEELAAVLVRFSEIAGAMSDRMDSIEVNPLLIGTDRAAVVAVDALMVPRDPTDDAIDDGNDERATRGVNA